RVRATEPVRSRRLIAIAFGNVKQSPDLYSTIANERRKLALDFPWLARHIAFAERYTIRPRHDTVDGHQHITPRIIAIRPKVRGQAAQRRLYIGIRGFG